MHWTEKLLKWLKLLGPIKVNVDEMNIKYEEYKKLAEEDPYKEEVK